MKGEIEESQLSSRLVLRQAQHRLRDAANSIRFLTRFGMTLSAKLLHGVYSELVEVFAMTGKGEHCSKLQGIRRLKIF
ncbi:hypothetical protein MYX76_09280 [Desulfobacterota bacterium AH_259_B03_O07]|nr:hypothetical protein [Desulfobacterota bacterium AH_259_B03_O07]